MTMRLVTAGEEPPERRPIRKTKGMPSKMVAGVENPATVLLHPIHFISPAVQWWSHDKVLLGGLKVNGVDKIEGGSRSDPILYLPTPIPRSWGERHIEVVVEYECESKGSFFQMRVHYGCGDPSELHKGESDMLQGEAGKKARIRFRLDEQYIHRNELLRVTLEIVRVSPKPVLVYGAWLEVTA